MIGRRDKRLKLALEIGADHIINNTKEEAIEKVMEYTNKSGATHVIPALGNYKLTNQSFGYLASGGRIEPGVNLPEMALEIDDIIRLGDRYNLPFVKDIKGKTTWSEEVISLENNNISNLYPD